MKDAADSLVNFDLFHVLIFVVPGVFVLAGYRFHSANATEYLAFSTFWGTSMVLSLILAIEICGSWEKVLGFPIQYPHLGMLILAPIGFAIGHLAHKRKEWFTKIGNLIFGAD